MTVAVPLATPALGPGQPRYRLRINALIGVSFIDQATLRPVSDRLTVVAWPVERPGAPRLAVRSPSGIYSFHGLPGLHRAEYPDRPGAAAESPPLQADFLIGVADPAGRFLPAVFGLPVPLDAAAAAAGSPLAPLDGRTVAAPLYPAPARPAGPALAVVRADLWDAVNNRPAAHARLRVRADGRDGLGIADDRGQVVVMFPWPTAARLDLGSPPGTSAGTPTRPSWPVTIEAFYQPGLLPPALPGEPLPPPWQRLPTLPTILTGQPPALIGTTTATPAAATWSGDLTFGEALVLRTAPELRLLIFPGASPP